MGQVVLCLSIQKQYAVVRINAVKIYLFTGKNLHTTNDVTSKTRKNNYAKSAHT